MIPGLDTPEKVHVAMLRGQIAPITMAQCAHIHGDKMMEAFNRWEELRGDVKTVSDILVDFKGEHAWQQAQNAVAHIEWLKNELKISKYNERAVLDALAQTNRQLKQGGGGYGDKARQTSGPAGAEQERTGEAAGAEARLDQDHARRT